MVIIILGSKSDLNWGNEIIKHLENFHVSYKIHIASAHKSPQFLISILEKYELSSQPVVYICVAGRSNALGGLVDGQVTAPVINCPPRSNDYAGLDILSSLRVPSGIGSATVLEPDQAALIALKILALANQKLRNKVSQYQKKLKEIINKSNQKINNSR